ncbi:MAG: hypothetical protein RIE08_12665 [Acidimicrobiales bacterium]
MRDHGEVPQRVVEQRIRNRIIEYLELAASFEAQAACQRAVPRVNVAIDVVNQWGDWVRTDPPTRADLPDVFSDAEVETMGAYAEAVNAAAVVLPGGFPDLAEVQRLKEWESLRKTAGEALRVFEVRGRLSEDREA